MPNKFDHDAESTGSGSGVSSRYSDGSYLAHNSNWHVEDSPWKASQINYLIQRNNLKPKRICEVGCGAGEILTQLSRMQKYRDAEFSGFEISDDAFELSRARQALNVHFFHEDLLAREKDQYDVVLCIDVFEHVDDYMGFLRCLREKGEYKIFHIPLDLSVISLIRGTLSEKRDLVGHLHYFTADTAIATLRDCGYQVLDSLFTPGFAALSPKTWKQRLIRPVRKILFKLSPKVMSTWIGGASLLVLAR